MIKSMKRSVSLLLCFLLIIGILTAAPLSASADSEPFSADGSCGKVHEEDIRWYAFDDRSMVFFGQGAMKDYALDRSGFSTAPWFSTDMSLVSNTIFSTKIVVESGVTTVGDYAFYLHPQYNSYVKAFMSIASIDLSDTVTSIGKYAFYRQVFETINLPPSVTYIGTNAFSQCNSLSSINYYGNPAQLVWDHTGSEAELSRAVTCHILTTYRGRESEFESQFSNVGLTFVADLENPYENAGEEEHIDRNIALYYGATNSGVFAGAVPYIVVGTFDGSKKSTTYGSSGFVSCVYVNNEYYLLTDTNGTLKKATRDYSTGRVTGCTDADSGLRLKIRHQYIGNNIVKVVYTLINDSGNEISGIKLGGTGDIKIGADDRAAIEPLKNNKNQQVGFYMTSSKEYDKSGDKYATLGFIGEYIVKDTSTNERYPDARFFYGEVGANLNEAGAGTRDKHVFPQRVFEPNAGKSYSDTEIAQGKDTGMSYHWDNITLSASGDDSQKEFAILYSVYGNSSNGTDMVNDLTADYYTVTWNNYDGSLLQKKVVKNGDTPVYSGSAPEKPKDTDNLYHFCGWSSDGGMTVYGEGQALPAVNGGNITYTAQYSAIGRPFYAKHSLTLNGDIGVNFYVDVTTIDGVTVENVQSEDKIVTLDFTWYDKHSTYEIKSSDYDAGKGLFKTTCNVAAAEMMYPITATAYVRDSGASAPGTELTGEKFTEKYRVRDYADVILDSGSEFSTTYNSAHPADYLRLVALVKSMLDYGAKAQVVFDRFRDIDRTPIELANNDIDYLMASHEITCDLPDMATGLDSLGLKYAGSSLVLLTTTTLKHYYIVRNNTTYESIKDKAYYLTPENERVNLNFEVNGSYVCLEIPGIPAASLDHPYEIHIGEQSFFYSPIQFAHKMQINPRYGEYDLATALYWYNVKAKDFFNNLQSGV